MFLSFCRYGCFPSCSRQKNYKANAPYPPYKYIKQCFAPVLPQTLLFSCIQSLILIAPPDLLTLKQEPFLFSGGVSITISCVYMPSPFLSIFVVPFRFLLSSCFFCTHPSWLLFYTTTLFHGTRNASAKTAFSASTSENREKFGHNTPSFSFSVPSPMIVLVISSSIQWTVLCAFCCSTRHIVTLTCSPASTAPNSLLAISTIRSVPRLPFGYSCASMFSPLSLNFLHLRPYYGWFCNNCRILLAPHVQPVISILIMLVAQTVVAIFLRPSPCFPLFLFFLALP